LLTRDTTIFGVLKSSPHPGSHSWAQLQKATQILLVHKHLPVRQISYQDIPLLDTLCFFPALHKQWLKIKQPNPVSNWVMTGVNWSKIGSNIHKVGSNARKWGFKS
jgi:hypothetical protein